MPDKGAFWTAASLRELEIHKVFLRSCALHLPENAPFQVRSSFAEGCPR